MTGMTLRSFASVRKVSRSGVVMGADLTGRALRDRRRVQALRAETGRVRIRGRVRPVSGGPGQD
ncbi:hypothetical protein GCM10027091_26480 [Streptomyces daliensis]